MCFLDQDACVFFKPTCQANELGTSSNILNSSRMRENGWSNLKYDTFTATYLRDLWSYGNDSCQEIVLESSQC